MIITMTKEQILNRIEQIKAEIKLKACCENTDELSDEAAMLHKELRKIDATLQTP